MRNFTKVLGVLLIALASLSLNGQDYVEIGDGTSYGGYPSYYGPWANYWENCHTQTLYFASELGDPKIFTDFAWEFQRLANAPDNYLLDVSIKILETNLTEMPYGNYVNMGGATEVFSSANFVPATSLGWRTVDIEDYPWAGGTNIIIDVVWGDNGYYEYPYYRTYKDYHSGTYRQEIGYSDYETPPNHDRTTNYYDNLRVYYLPFTPPGDVEGYVYEAESKGPLAGAIVYSIDYPQFNDTSDFTGYYKVAGIYSGLQPFACHREGYYPDSADLQVPEGGVLEKDWYLGQPEMYINPLSLDVVVNPNEYYETNIGILNQGTGPLQWTAEIAYINPTMSLPIIRTQNSGPDKYPDADPNAPVVKNTNNSRDMWDIQIIWDAEAGAGNVYLSGAECDGEYFYITRWNSGSIYRYELDGTYVGSFSIPGASNLRDLAYDGEYFYGGAASTTIYEMDFESQTLISSISSPTAVRAIAYDWDQDGFWVNNWSSTLTLVSRTGSTLNTIANPPSIYGMAYDNYSDGGPYLWLFSGTTSGGG
ncbi:MAG: hypothetical protein K9G67_07680, partial [Bacteroidales bacterium]|nr:hypothetical protein [Bacteroidales bacterium]MCF8376221.1 hypothetical protein [Bacteroidales bacterium]